MADKSTIQQYELLSDDFIERYSSIKPGRIYDLIATFFHSEQKTLDIGCASGRDLSYLKGSGFDIEGLDAVDKFVTHCKEHLPSVPIHKDSLPKLETIKNEIYDNVLLSAILMHLPGHEIIEAASNIIRITKPNGRILISIRNLREVLHKEGEERETDGRLFTPIPKGRLINLFEGLGCKLLFEENQAEGRRNDVIWHNFVFEKTDSSTGDGIDRIQEILLKDKKSSTYKLATLRGLNYLARHEFGSVRYDENKEFVWVPLKRLAFTWIKYYFPLIKAEIPFRQTSAQNLAISTFFQNELGNYSSGDLSLLITDYETGLTTEIIDQVLSSIANTIKNQPMQYITNQNNEPVFPYMNRNDAGLFFKSDSEAGAIGVPVSIWHDLTKFGNWIDDSLFLQWAQYTKKLDQERSLGEILSALMEPSEDIRSTQIIRDLYTNKSIECVWSGETLTTFQVDHAIPYSLWKNNDLWNLLPCQSTLNGQKGNKLPSKDLILKRKDCIINYWEQYQKVHTNYFEYQLRKSLGVTTNHNWQHKTFLSFLETVSRLSVYKIGDIWEY